MAACSDGGQGIAAAVREMLGSGGLGEEGDAQSRLLDRVDALVVARSSGRCGFWSPPILSQHAMKYHFIHDIVSSILICHMPNRVLYFHAASSNSRPLFHIAFYILHALPHAAELTCGMVRYGTVRFDSVGWLTGGFFGGGTNRRTFLFARSALGGRLFDGDRFLELWDEAREAAVSLSAPPPSEEPGRPTPLALYLGIGGHGPRVAEKLSFLVNARAFPEQTDSIRVDGITPRPEIPGIVPDLFFGDLRAGDGASTAETIEFCREHGVQAFSIRHVGGQGGEEAWRGAAAAADFEHEDVSVKRRVRDYSAQPRLPA